MIVRAIDLSGDWTFGKGRNDYLSGNPAVAQNLVTRLRSFLGDCFFDMPAGVDWFNQLGGKNVLGLTRDVKTVILNTQYVTRIISLGITLDSARDLGLSYEVDTVFPGTIKTSARYLLTESGLILTTEGGDPIHV